MRISQLSLQTLKNDGTPDGRSTRWQKLPSFAKLHRQGNMGGSIRYRKSKRPFDSSKALHVVLKSHHCRAGFQFTEAPVRLKIEQMVRDLARKANVTVYKVAVVHNHIHLLLHAKRPKSIGRFLRSFAGVLAKRMRKWAKLRGLIIKMDRFWSARPYSRLVHFGRQWRNVIRYLEKNRQEASGFVEYTPRNHPIQHVLKKIQRQIDKLSAAVPIVSTA